nr:uncharacterized protein C11orf98 homolog [Nerophis lumbriciformis]
MAPPGGKINRPKTELSKRLFKRRRVLGRHKKKKKNGNAGVVPDRGLVTVRRLEMRNAAVTLSGKKRRKLLKRLRRLRNDKVGTEGESRSPSPPNGPRSSSTYELAYVGVFAASGTTETPTGAKGREDVVAET